MLYAGTIRPDNIYGWVDSDKDLEVVAHVLGKKISQYPGSSFEGDKRWVLAEGGPSYRTGLNTVGITVGTWVDIHCTTESLEGLDIDEPDSTAIIRGLRQVVEGSQDTGSSGVADAAEPGEADGPPF
jgi:hypothetical protein